MQPPKPAPSHGANAQQGAYLAGLDARTRARLELVIKAVITRKENAQIAQFIAKDFENRRDILYYFVKDRMNIKGALFDPEIEQETDFIVLIEESTEEGRSRPVIPRRPGALPDATSGGPDHG